MAVDQLSEVFGALADPTRRAILLRLTEGDANVMTVGMVYRDPDLPASMGPETPESFVASTGLTLPTVLGEWGRERSRWGFGGVPTAFLLDVDHVVRQVFVGSADATTIVAAVGD